MPNSGVAAKEAEVGTAANKIPEAVPEAPPGPLEQHWPELGKPKAAEVSGAWRQAGGAADKRAPPLAWLNSSDREELEKREEAEEDDEEEDAEEAEAEEMEDGDTVGGSTGRRRRRRRRNRRSSTAANAENPVPSLPHEVMGTSTSEDEALARSRNVVTWNDLLGTDHDLKPESPSGGFQCAAAACWGRFAQQQLQHQNRQQLPQQRSLEPVMESQQEDPSQQILQQQAQQACYDLGPSSKVVPLMPASFGSGVQWVVTDAPPEWSPNHTAQLQNWFCHSMAQGSVPQLSQLDIVLQSLASDTYED